MTLCLLLGGCVAQPPATRGAPRLEPPQAQPQRLSREQVLEQVTDLEPAAAIELLDRYPFDFELDEEALRWFGARGLDPALNDYLAKRSRVDWEALRGR